MKGPVDPLVSPNLPLVRGTGVDDGDGRAGWMKIVILGHDQELPRILGTEDPTYRKQTCINQAIPE